MSDPNSMPATPPAIHSPPAPNPATPGAVHAPPVSGGVPTLVITGSLSFSGGPLTFPPLLYAGEMNGRPFYAPNGVPDGLTQAFWEVTRWMLYWDGNYVSWSSYDDVATPDLATPWSWNAEYDAQGDPSVSLTGSLASPPAIHSPPARTPGTPPVITP